MNPKPDFPSLLSQAGYHLCAGAAPKAIAALEAVYKVSLPDEFKELWSLTDGVADVELEILSLDGIQKYAAAFDTFFGDFGYVPFTDSNDSNPYSMVCRGPLRGMIVHIFHDDQPVLVCRSLRRFFELVAAQRYERNERDVARLAGDLAVAAPNRTETDAAIARELIRAAAGLDIDDENRYPALEYAAQLLGPGHERQLAEVLALGNEYTREIVRNRCVALGTLEARALLRQDNDAYKQFLVDLKQAFEAVGYTTEPMRDRAGFWLQPGRIGLNFAKLYTDCRRPGVMAQRVQRIKERDGRK